ncbi:MAG TPA: response regulator transcription factor [Flavobacteriales bacterium]|nr:response regulator transcription factor [Flavobacteriales bacterium]
MTPLARLLVVEDDPNLGTMLTNYLRARGYEADLRTDGQQGAVAFGKGKYDLILLDVMMPLKDGFTLAKEIRSKDAEVPIIFLTAKSMKQDTLIGFQSGADDYITKPFGMEELLLRIGAVLRRTKGAEPQIDEPVVYRFSQSELDHRKQVLRTPVGERRLTTKENELLRLLCVHRNQVLERTVALNQVWGHDSYFNGRSMDVYIAKLRKYLKEDPATEIINIHGTGFRLVAPDAQ